MISRTSIAAAALLGALATAATAQAGTVSYDAKGALVYSAAPGEANDLGLWPAGDGSGRVSIYDVRAGSVSAPADRCEQIDPFTAFCETPASVRVVLGDGDDRTTIGGALGVAGAVRLEGGTGNDVLEGVVGADTRETLDGGPGDDVLRGMSGDDVLLGADGRDTLDGGAGADGLDGGAGDDLLHGDRFEAAGSDVIDGGPGVDTVDEDWVDRATGARLRLTVTLAGGADDGRPGEGDELRSVERVRAYQPGSLTGTEGTDDLEVVQVAEGSDLLGLGGDDRLRTSDGPDRIDGGAGADDIDAGFGDDVILAGPGRDRVSADRAGGDCGPAWCKVPSGNDVVDVRDGEPDSVSCGPGADTVTADAADTVAADCEQVERAGVIPRTSSPEGAARRIVVAGPPRLGAALRTGVRVRLSGFAPGRVTVRATGGGKVLAGARVAVGRDGSGTARLHFTAAARRSLRRARSVRLVVTAGTARGVVVLRR